jgi:predicted RNA binding protein YcfA (HicA-like mRNA interferase family)
MPVSARKMDSILVNKLGFSRRGRKHRIYTLQIEGREVARTLISHGAKEISDRMLATMARQMGITSSQLKAIVRGELSREDYYQLLRQKGWLE